MSCSQREPEVTDLSTDCSVLSDSVLAVSPQSSAAAVEVAVCYRAALLRRTVKG
jgi:hypothetical protein